MFHRGFRYRLYPTPAQADALEQTAGAVRFVYNLALEQRQTFWRQAKRAGVVFNYASQGREIKELRRDLPWLAEVDSNVLHQALIDLDAAYKVWWRGGGHPRFRSKARHCSFRLKGLRVRFEQTANPRFMLIRIPKIGMVKLRITRPWKGRIVSVTVSRDAVGWHVGFRCDVDEVVEPSALPAVGADRGIANVLALSTGEMVSFPYDKALDRRLRRSQRQLARKSRGSARYAKQRRRLASLASRIARKRAHWRQEVTTGLVRRFGLIAVEKLAVRAMTAKGGRKHGLNRAIRDRSWSDITNLLTYKLEDRGGTIVYVDPRYTSQTCSACGVIDKQSRESQARFACSHCGFTHHADTNAAVNILRRSAATAEGCGYAPNETGIWSIGRNAEQSRDRAFVEAHRAAGAAA